MKQLKRVKSNDKYVDRLGGFVNWNNMSEDAGHKAKRQFHVKKEQRTSIAHLLPAGGRPSAHQPATGSVACLKKTRWDAEKQKKTKIWYTVIDMARRLAVGRTPELVISLMETRLFSSVVQSVWTGSMHPQRGLQSDLPIKGRVSRQVTILDTYTRCGVCVDGRCLRFA